MTTEAISSQIVNDIEHAINNAKNGALFVMLDKPQCRRTQDTFIEKLFKTSAAPGPIRKSMIRYEVATSDDRVFVFSTAGEVNPKEKFDQIYFEPGTSDDVRSKITALFSKGR